jgi:HD-GYP domain-containing protein (c-di-GMP phosphodiesterase class II)
VSPLLLHHHERWDGRGYPHGLGGEEIPLGSRILFVADAYDAMTSDRVYRPRVDHEHALAELERCAGTQFDPEVVAVFSAGVRLEEVNALKSR